MINLDRKTAPGSLPIEAIQFLVVKKEVLQNGIPVYQINAGTQNIIKLELIFEAGHWNCKNPLLADFTNRMLIEGSLKYTSSEIAEKFDFYGTFYNFECGKHFASVQLYSLGNFFEKSIEIFESFVKFPTFPEREFKVHLKNDYQQYMLGREKTELLAAEAFYSKIFGNKHPYGIITQAEDFQKLSIEQLKLHHNQYYHPAACKIIVAGLLDNTILEVLNKYFGGSDWPIGTKSIDRNFEFEKPGLDKFAITKKGAAQASIRLGKRTISKHHEDYHGLSIVNTILGGYFGSRLMTNLREKSALTYGIYSSLSSLLYSGVFSVAANVHSEQAENAVNQIINEISILREQLISAKELEMVKNYLRGEMLRVFDGPLQVSEIYTGLLNFNLDFDYYQDYFDTIKSIQPENIRELANKYLNTDSFTTVLAGNF
ncbi:MAG: pitrilysin family protein [Bacteroidales bacterium]|nr:pitrilysin family protein [Bacteroidales bacterium]